MDDIRRNASEIKTATLQLTGIGYKILTSGKDSAAKMKVLSDLSDKISNHADVILENVRWLEQQIKAKSQQNKHLKKDSQKQKRRAAEAIAEVDILNNNCRKLKK